MNYCESFANITSIINCGGEIVSIKNKLKQQTIDVKTNDDHLKMLVYAQGGVGKTVLSATASQLDGDVLFISAERGTKSIRLKKWNDRIDLSRIHVVGMDNFIDFNDYYEFLYDHIELVKKYEEYRKSGDNANASKMLETIWNHQSDQPRNKGEMPRFYKTVVIDSLTEVQRRSLDRIVDTRTGQVNPGSITRGVKFENNRTTLQDYGDNTQQMRKLVRAFRDLEMNVIFTALEAEVQDELTGKITIRPAVTEKLWQDVNGYVDIVARMFTATKDKQVERKIAFQPYGNYTAKDRSGALGMGMTDATVKQIVDKINAETV